jgi:hypothetical protein
MPTNKLWIEHTERAAWDSVEALRERLVKAEARLQALAPHVEQLPQLLDALERAKEQLALPSGVTAPGEVVSSLLARIEQHAAELVAARQSAPIAIDFSTPAPRPRLDSEDLEGPASDSFEDEPQLLEDFTRAMRRQEGATGRALPRDLNRLLELAETKLDDMTELEGSALREAALDLALVAARVHAASRNKA